MSETSRRAVLAGAAGVSVAGVLAACGTAADDSYSPSGPDNGQATTGAPTGGTSSGAATSSGPASGGSAAGLAKKSDIPVGGGKVFQAEGVVVTQPTAGTFKAFTAVCTHQGCTVANVANGTISCGCHGSQFSAADGSVKRGPATKALAARGVKVDGDSISVTEG